MTLSNDRYYVLRDRIPVACDMMTWSREFSEKDRRVAFTDMGSCSVSTVFLGLDHSFGYGPPKLFETMVFSEDKAADEMMERYSTWDEAVAGHNKMVDELRRKLFKVVNGSGR